MDVADEQIDATSRAFLGLTVACARCHDHKFDPIPTEGLLRPCRIFQSTQTCYGTVRILQSNHPSPLIDLPKDAGVTVGLEPLSADRRTAIEKDIQDSEGSSQQDHRDECVHSRASSCGREVSMLQSQLDLYEADGTPKPAGDGRARGAACRSTAPSCVAASWTSRASGVSAAFRRC